MNMKYGSYIIQESLSWSELSWVELHFSDSLRLWILSQSVSVLYVIFEIKVHCILEWNVYKMELNSLEKKKTEKKPPMSGQT